MAPTGAGAASAAGLGALRARRYAAVYLPHRSRPLGRAGAAVRCPERIGFADSAAALTYTRRVPRPRDGPRGRAAADAGWIDATVAAPVSLGLTADDHGPPTDAGSRRTGSGPGFVALAPGSIWGTKRWPYYAELAAAAGPAVRDRRWSGRQLAGAGHRGRGAGPER